MSYGVFFWRGITHSGISKVFVGLMILVGFFSRFLGGMLPVESVQATESFFLEFSQFIHAVFLMFFASAYWPTFFQQEEGQLYLLQSTSRTFQWLGIWLISLSLGFLTSIILTAVSILFIKSYWLFVYLNTFMKACGILSMSLLFSLTFENTTKAFVLSFFIYCSSLLQRTIEATIQTQEGWLVKFEKLFIKLIPVFQLDFSIISLQHMYYFFALISLLFMAGLWQYQKRYP